jgi:hypothetical protein
MQSLDYEIADFHWKAPEIREVRFDRYNHRPAVVFRTRKRGLLDLYRRRVSSNVG